MPKGDNKFPWVSLYERDGRWRLTTCAIGRRGRITRRLGMKRSNAERFAAQVSGWLDQWKSGVIGESKVLQMLNETKPLVDWIVAYKRELETNGREKDYIATIVPRVRILCETAEITLVRELTPEAVKRGLEKLRDEGHAGGRNLSDQTRKHYQRAIQQFANFLAAKKAIADNPLGDLASVSVDTKVRRRRPPTEEEVRILMAHVWASRKGMYNLSGPDRAMLYAFAMATGYRAKELRSVRSDFINDGVLAVPGVKTKNGDDAFQPLPAWLIERYQAWWGDRRPGLLWPAIPSNLAKTLRHDLEHSRSAWIAAAGEATSERDEREKSATLMYEVGGRYLDFHALRHRYISALVGAGEASIKEAQHLARHSTVELTVGLYSHADAVKLRGVVERSIQDPMAGTFPTTEALAQGGSAVMIMFGGFVIETMG